MNTKINNKLSSILISVNRLSKGAKPFSYNQRVISDKECNGLRFVGSNNGVSGEWVRRYKSSTGKMKQYAFGVWPDVSLNDARHYVESVRGQENPIIRTIGQPTIGRLIDVYLNEYIKAQRKQQGVLNVRSVLVKNLQPIITTNLDQVTASMLHELILTVKKRAPSTAAALRAELTQAWSYGLSIGLTTAACPITSMTGGKFKRIARDRILTDAEVPLLLANLDDYSEALADVIVICLYTGLRSGEVIAIHYDEISFEDGVGWLTIPRERMKNNMAHRVPLFSLACIKIAKRMSQYHPVACGGYLFPSRYNALVPIKQVTLGREVYATHGAVDNWRLHDLRRTARTNLQRIGCPFEISETILAHKLPGVSSVYARYQYNDEKIEWLTKLADYYDK